MRWSEWMQCTQQGDKLAYQQLLEELSLMIKNYLISRLGPLDIIDDCVQDILLSLHRARHTYQPDRPFRPWLFAIIHNRSLDNLRKQGSYLKLVGEFEQNRIFEQLSQNTIDEQIVQSQLIAKLALPFRQAIVLTKLCGFSNAEAARKLRISETAVKVRVHRGIAKLKKLLELEQ